MARRRVARLSFFLLALAFVLLEVACEGLPDEVGTKREEPRFSGGAEGAGGSMGQSGFGGEAGASTSGPLELSGDLEVHDPTVLESNGQFFLLHTGTLLPLKISSNLLEWQSRGSAFEVLPEWITDTLPGVTGLWAPHLARFGGRVHLYYAASTFGSGRSCIGHATAPELSLTAVFEGHVFEDHGPVICSDVEEEVDWDAIDPSTFEDEAGERKMVFGSYGSGIKLIALNPDGTRADAEMIDLAERPEEIALQAPAALYRAPYYYLFASFDRCCEGVNSTSNIRVGRSTAAAGPYLDREGTELLLGGGSVFVSGDDRFRGAGASEIFLGGSRQYHAYHAYDANAAGRATLRIFELRWDEEGWPVRAGP